MRDEGLTGRGVRVGIIDSASIRFTRTSVASRRRFIGPPASPIITSTT